MRILAILFFLKLIQNLLICTDFEAAEVKYDDEIIHKRADRFCDKLMDLSP